MHTESEKSANQDSLEQNIEINKKTITLHLVIYFIYLCMRKGYQLYFVEVCSSLRYTEKTWSIPPVEQITGETYLVVAG